MYEMLQSEDVQSQEAYYISAELDYPGVETEHSHITEINRVIYDSITDDEALEAFQLLSKTEGIIPALESAHAVAYAMKLAKKCTKNEIILISLSGRGDKDVQQVKDRLEAKHNGKRIHCKLFKRKTDFKQKFIRSIYSCWGSWVGAFKRANFVFRRMRCCCD